RLPHEQPLRALLLGDGLDAGGLATVQRLTTPAVAPLSLADLPRFPAATHQCANQRLAVDGY
ncbi:MAG: hypothetical protein ACRDTJ_12765, partial [Pseudonocardiaceae bacterium]